MIVGLNRPIIIRPCCLRPLRRCQQTIRLESRDENEKDKRKRKELVEHLNSYQLPVRIVQQLLQP
jgi:hypothetical protein